MFVCAEGGRVVNILGGVCRLCSHRILTFSTLDCKGSNKYIYIYIFYLRQDMAHEFSIGVDSLPVMANLVLCKSIRKDRDHRTSRLNKVSKLIRAWPRGCR